MDGFWFYWGMWLIVIAYFFYDNNKKRKEKWIFICLLLLISSAITLPLWTISFRLSFFLIGFLCFYHLASISWGNKLFSYLIGSLVSGVYLLTHYFIYFEPVWLYVSPLIMTCALAVFIVIVFIKKPKNRVANIVAGLFQGELLFVLFLWERSHLYFQTIIVGDYFFLDVFSLSVLVVLCWNGIESAVSVLRSRVTYLPPHTRQGKMNA